MDKANLRVEATKWREWFYKGQRNWSALHHGTIFGSIICSVTAGGLLQITEQELKGLSTVFTMAAAALTSLAASGGFERKWRSNRLSRSRVDCLLIDIEADMPNLTDLANQLKDIIAKHDEEIVKVETPKPKAQAAENKG